MPLSEKILVFILTFYVAARIPQVECNSFIEAIIGQVKGKLHQVYLLSVSDSVSHHFTGLSPSQRNKYHHGHTANRLCRNLIYSNLWN